MFEPPFGGLGTTYDVHLGLIGKPTRLLISVNYFNITQTVFFLLGLRLCFVASASATKVIEVVADAADISAKRT